MEGFTRVEEVLEKKEGSFAVRGWVHRRRDLKNKIFIVLRDATGVLQCVFDSGFEEELQGVGLESSIKVWGEAARDERAPGGVELKPSKLEVVSATEFFPINKDLSTEFLLDVRHLWLRSTKMNSALKLRDFVMRACRDFFHSKGFYEVSAPMFVSQAGEEGSTQFEVDYFGDKAFLSQTGQLHLEAAMFSLEKVYSFGPSFRAEKSKTWRHLTEYWHLEGEMAWMSHEESMDLQEELVKSVAKRVYEECREELEELGANVEGLKKVFEKSFVRITYEQAVKDLKSMGVKMERGDSLGTEEEQKLPEKYGAPVFVEKFPKDMKAFYMKEDPDNPGLVLCSDLLLPEVGETIGGSERETDHDKLLERIEAMGDDPENYEWYLDLRKYGSVPHSGFGLGVERLIMSLAGLDHIRDAIPFPRTINRTYP